MHSVPPQPTGLQSFPGAGDLHQARSKSKPAPEIKYSVSFTNNTGRNVDLIWKDYDGVEVTVLNELMPGKDHRKLTFFTHPFIARDSVTRQLRSFYYQSITSVVFEGLKFGASPNTLVEVSIGKGKVKRSELGL